MKTEQVSSLNQFNWNFNSMRHTGLEIIFQTVKLQMLLSHR